MKPLLIVSILSFLAYPQVVLAQKEAALQSFSPELALQTAMEHSPALQKAEAAREEAGWKKEEGLSVFIPTVDLTANHFFVKKFEQLDLVFGGGPVSIPQVFPASSATLEAKWLLFDGFGNVNTYRAASKYKDGAEAAYDWARFQLDHDVNLAYAHVVAAKKLAAVTEQNLKTLENHLSQVKNLKAGGLATNYDVLRVEAQLSEGQSELLQAQDNIQIAQEKLGQTLGLAGPVDATDSELATPDANPVKNLNFKNEATQRLDLQSLQANVDAVDLMEDAHALFWVPKIGLTGQYIKYNNLTDTLSDWNSYRPAWNVGFYLTWELFNVKDFSRAKQEKYRARQSEKDLLQANLQAPVDFAFWKKRYLYSASLYEAKKVDLERDQETVRLAEAGFKAGVRTTTEVLDAELELFRARAGIVNTQMNCIEAKIKLELSTGEKI